MLHNLLPSLEAKAASGALARAVAPESEVPPIIRQRPIPNAYTVTLHPIFANLNVIFLSTLKFRITGSVLAITLDPDAAVWRWGWG